VCVQIDFRASGMFHTNRACILHQDYRYLQNDQTRLPFEPLNIGVPLSASTMVSKPMVH